MRIAIVIILGIICTAIVVFVTVKEHQNAEDYFQQLNLQMTGVVETKPDCPNSSNGFCVIDIKVLKANIKEYDPRGKRDYYYGILKDGRAEIYQLGAHELDVGDTVSIDTNRRVLFCHNKNKSFAILLPANDHFFEYVKRKYQKL